MRKLSVLLLAVVVMLVAGSTAIAYPNPFNTAQNQSPGIAYTPTLNVTNIAPDQTAISPPTSASCGSMTTTVSMTTAPPSTFIGTNGAMQNESMVTLDRRQLNESPPNTDQLSTNSGQLKKEAPTEMEARYVYIGNEGQAGSSLNRSVFGIYNVTGMMTKSEARVTPWRIVGGAEQSAQYVVAIRMTVDLHGGPGYSTS